MPFRARALALVLSLVTTLVIGAAPGVGPEPAAAAAKKVAIIVGPVGGLTSTYRSSADRVANAAAATGASVVKVYSPNATWANARAAVNGADVIVYFGHGNGSPNPYTGWDELTDRTNGWGLNTSTTNGDKDSWSAGTLVYCGEKALLGTLGPGDGAAQRTHCGSGAITPAPGFTMIYAQAHYAPGFGERYTEGEPIPSLAEAQARVQNYSYPALRLGAAGYIATAYSDAHDIVTRVLTQPTTAFGDIFRAGRGFSSSALETTAHSDVGGAEVWVQKTVAGSLHFGDPDYWYAFAGDPSATPGGGAGSFVAPPFSDISGSKFYNDILWLDASGITSGCGNGRFCPDGLVTRAQMASFLSRALNLPATSRDYYADDNGNKHEANINRLAAAGITSGCADGRFCPEGIVLRDQMASFLKRSIPLPASSVNWFSDDAGNKHESAINAVATADVTRGCASGRYCPSGAVTRGQMAAFLHRAFGD